MNATIAPCSAAGAALRLHVEPPVPPPAQPDEHERPQPPLPPGTPYPGSPVKDPPPAPPDAPAEPPAPIVGLAWPLLLASPDSSGKRAGPMRLLDSRFRYIPAAKTDVGATWRRFGFRPTTESERRARQRANPSGTDDTSPNAGRDIELAPPRLSSKSGTKPSLKLAR